MATALLYPTVPSMPSVPVQVFKQDVRLIMGIDPGTVNCGVVIVKTQPNELPQVIFSDTLNFKLNKKRANIVLSIHRQLCALENAFPDICGLIIECQMRGVMRYIQGAMEMWGKCELRGHSAVISATKAKTVLGIPCKGHRENKKSAVKWWESHCNIDFTLARGTTIHNDHEADALITVLGGVFSGLADDWDIDDY